MSDELEGEFEFRDLLPDMMSTQLIAADVYATFYKYGKGDEKKVWESMLQDELAHVRFVGMMMEEENLPEVELSPIKLDAFRELAQKALSFAPHSAFERTLWALRIEHAQIDFGLEALAVNQIHHDINSPVFPGAPVKEHYCALLKWASRYQGASEIAMQMARIEEHFPCADDEKLSQNINDLGGEKGLL